MNLAFFPGGAPGLPEILVIVFIILLLFGAKKLPELARSIGRSLTEFKKGRQEDNSAGETEAIAKDSTSEKPDTPAGA